MWGFLCGDFCHGRLAIAYPINFDYSIWMTYSVDFRGKVLSVREKEGLTIAQVAARFDIGVASVVRWLKQPEPKVHGFRRHKIDRDALARDIENTRCLSIAARCTFWGSSKCNLPCFEYARQNCLDDIAATANAPDIPARTSLPLCGIGMRAWHVVGKTAFIDGDDGSACHLMGFYAGAEGTPSVFARLRG